MSTNLPATANATSANPPASEVEEGSEETKEGNGESRESIMDQMRDHKVDKADKKREKMLEDMGNTRLYYIIDPDNTSKQVWDVVVLLMVVVNLFTIPISMAAQFDNTPSPVFSTFVDILFIADLFVTFFTAYNLTNGERIWYVLGFFNFFFNFFLLSSPPHRRSKFILYYYFLPGNTA